MGFADAQPILRSKRIAGLPRNDGFDASDSKRMTASAIGAGVATKPVVVWSVIAVVPVRRHLRALTKGITDEAYENDEADRCNNPIRHDLIHPSRLAAMRHTLRGISLTFTAGSDRDSSQILST